MRRHPPRTTLEPNATPFRSLPSLVLAAMMRDPGLDYTKPHPKHIERGFDWLVQQQKDDGGIYVKGLATYNTSSAIMALLARDREEDQPMILKAREFLINQQTDWGSKGTADNKYDGGIGYGGTYAHSDMSNTYLAIEALYHSRFRLWPGRSTLCARQT